MVARTSIAPREDAAAYGGQGWSPRIHAHSEEIGALWSDCGIDSEWRPLKAVILHCPGEELAAAAADPDAVQMLAPLDPARAAAQHQSLARAYREAGVRVHEVAPQGAPSPNLMFCADLFVMTPEGAVLARPASTVRAGEERQMARRLADLGVPILRTLRGDAVFEGADLMWVDDNTAVAGRGLRTNHSAIQQIGACLAEQGRRLISVDLAPGCMHLMGQFRIADRDLAICRRNRVPPALLEVLSARGYQVAFLPEAAEAESNQAINFVTLGPRRILMAAGNPLFEDFYTSLGIDCRALNTGELSRAAGNIGCLSGVLWRQHGDVV